LVEGYGSEVSIFVDLIMSAIGSGSVYHRGFGIKKRSWFVSGRSRPAFMEPLGVPLRVPLGVPPGVPPPNGGKGVPPPNGGNYVRLAGAAFGGDGGEGVPPPNDGNYVRLVEGGGDVGSDVGGGHGSGLRMRRRSSSFPLKDDAGYIGYLSDDESGGSGDEGGVLRLVDRRRRELIGSEISFSSCMFMMIMVCGLLMLFLFAASPWGVPPPRRL